VNSKHSRRLTHITTSCCEGALYISRVSVQFESCLCLFSVLQKPLSKRLIYLLALRHSHQAFTEIFQFANIARPRVTGQEVCGILREPDLLVFTGVEQAEKFIYEQ